MIYVFLAEGFEESEALIPSDILVRAGKKVVTVSVTGRKEVKSSHGFTIVADTLFDDNDYDDAELIFLPGGMPGSTNLFACDALCDLILERNKNAQRIAAICAAPGVVLGQLGILEGRKATCYPGFEQYMTGAEYTARLVETDGHIITGEGPAAAFPLGYELVSQLVGPDVADKVAEGMRFKHLMAR